MDRWKHFIGALVLGAGCASGMAQDVPVPLHPYGLNGGLMFSLGTHFQRVGLFVSGYYHVDYVQFNARLGVLYHFKGLGPAGGIEKQVNIGPLLALGKKDSLPDLFTGPVGNQTGRPYSIGYSYNMYFDRQNTSQRTGTIGLGAGKWGLVHENDLLASPGSDKYRTAAIMLYYTEGRQRVALQSILYTGNINSPGAKRVRGSSFARYGYIDLSETEHGKYSHGILSLGYSYLFPYQQVGRVALGIDSEHIRNGIQNKFMHDLYFVPEKWNKAHNLHLPMVTKDGKAYLYLPDQQLREARFFADISANGSLFY